MRSSVLHRRGVILPVVLFVLLLLGLLVAMFAFRVNADVASTRAIAYRLHTRLAAEAGIERVKLMLREARYDVNRWYHNLDELHRVIVWIEDGDQTAWGTNDEFDEPHAAYRFSIVADDPTDDEERIRLGITDESAKLNLNTATERQLMVLVGAALADDEEADPRAVVDAILDWRDPDRTPRSEDEDTEGEYYKTLPKPYHVKNGPFDTVEEMLLVKGVTGQLLYGEDYDRNGLLTPNEEDGYETFPLDNEDDVLNRGIYPYLTVLSAENNVANDNRARAYLLGEEAKLRAELELAFPDDPAVVNSIVTAARTGGSGQGKGDGGPNKPGKGGGDGGADNPAKGDGASETGPDSAGTLPGESGGEDPGESDEPNDGSGPAGTGEPGGAETDDAGSAPGPIRSPASLLRNANGTSLLTLEHLPVLMDRTTVIKPEQRTVPGLINVNTAPPLVLRCIDGLTGEQIGAILEARSGLDSETKATTAWLVTEGVVDLETFEQIAPQITARGQQFRIESLGYADHIGMVTRLEVVVDMLGPVARTVYYRDLTYLGGRYPIREEDLETIRVR